MAADAMTSLSIDSYVIDTLMRDLTGHDRQPSAFLVYLYFYRWSAAERQRTVAASLREIAEATGLSKRSVQTAISRLHQRKLISIRRKNITDIPRYAVLSPWQH